MMNKQYFIIVLGDLDNQLNRKMFSRLHSIGDVIHVTDNIYLLNKSGDFVDLNKVRSDIAGDEGGYCIVFRFNNEISFAWSLPSEQSDLFKQIIKDVYDERK